MSQETKLSEGGNANGEAEMGGSRERLGKKLSYLLRYGAKQEGLSVSPTGFVRLDDLVEVPLLEGYTAKEVLNEVRVSKSYGGKRRYEDKVEDQAIYVRATYNRFERNPYHEDTKVPRLLESCMEHICSNIKNYPLEDRVDECLVHEILRKLKRRGKLTNVALENLLGPNIKTLNLDGALITQKAPEIIVQQSPYLRKLSLKDCGYLITDHVITFLIKRLPELRDLNLRNCSHLTSNAFRIIPKHLPQLQTLDLSFVMGLTQSDLLTIIEGCLKLEKILFFGVKMTFSDGACVRIAKVCAERPLKVLYDNQNVNTR